MKNLKYKVECVQCKKNFVTNLHNKKLCSEKCKNLFYQRNSKTDISSGSIGAISELVICSDLLKKGYAVFRSVSPSCFCDVIAIKGDEVKKLEIRTGYRSTADKLAGRILFPRKLSMKNGIPNEFAVYVRGEEKVYYDLVTNEDIEKSK